MSTARSPRRPALRASALAIALFLALITITASLAPLASAAPQVVGTPVATSAARPSASATGTAASSAQPTGSASASASASGTATGTPTATRSGTATPTPTDPCTPGGRCVPPGKSQECLVLQKVWAWRNMTTNAYLPVDLRPYFQDRFGSKYDASSFPSSMHNVSDLNALFGDETWSLFAKQGAFFNQKQAGCNAPRQKYFTTWAFVDMVAFFKSKGDPCSSDANMQICASTLDQRAESIMGDLNNSTYCDVAPEYNATGQLYVKQLQEHPFRSTLPTCISGDTIEADIGRCGWYTQYGACMNKDKCPSLPKDLLDQCDQIIKTYVKKSTTSDDSTDDTKKSKLPVTAIVVGSIAGVIAIGGVLALARTRKTANVFKTLGRSIGRTLHRGTSRAAMPPPPPMHPAPPPTPAMAVAAVPLAVPAATATGTPAPAALQGFVDQFGNPVAPEVAASYMSYHAQQAQATGGSPMLSTMAAVPTMPEPTQQHPGAGTVAEPLMATPPPSQPGTGTQRH
ncbi:hypothetical protein GGF32_000277 [Allomyces javanicus]|nr:hypothetical protein GGF32_000277 [Allomyces javanicus]